MMQQTQAPVRRTIVVAAPQETAFRVFTEGFGTWWPKEYHIGQVDMADFVLEPKADGRWYEVGVDGSECEVGRVLAYEPPDRVTIAWHLDGTWQYDPDPAHASEVEVRFVAEDPSHTRVELEHRGFERHGEGAEAVRQGVGGDTGGWGYCLDLYAKRVAAA